MSNLHKKLLSLYPDYQEGDWETVHVKPDTFISEWNRQEPKPTQADLDAVTAEVADKAIVDYYFRHRFSDKKDKAIITWIAQTQGLTLQQALSEIRTIWDRL